MNKVIILRKIHVTMKSFAPPLVNHFSLSLNRKRVCGNENHEKETKHIHASATDLLHITIGNLDWRAREASLHPAFMGICPTISHTRESHVLALSI